MIGFLQYRQNETMEKIKGLLVEVKSLDRDMNSKGVTDKSLWEERK